MAVLRRGYSIHNGFSMSNLDALAKWVLSSQSYMMDIETQGREQPD